MPTINTNPVAAVYARLVLEMRDAQKAEKQASAAYEAVKAKIKALAKTLEIGEIESDVGKIVVFSQEGGKYLDPAKVKAILSQEQYESCLSDKAASTAIRLTLKNQ